MTSFPCAPNLALYGLDPYPDVHAPDDGEVSQGTFLNFCSRRVDPVDDGRYDQHGEKQRDMTAGDRRRRVIKAPAHSAASNLATCAGPLKVSLNALTAAASSSRLVAPAVGA